MKVLLTGGAGFIASHVAEAYLAAGHEVLTLDSLVAGRREQVPAAASFEQIDVRDPRVEEFVDSFRPDVINHHAAQPSVKISTGDPVNDLSVNGGGTAWLTTLAVRYGVRKFIYISSGGTVYGEPIGLPVDETHPIAPVSPYGTSKHVGEDYVRMAARTGGLDFTIFRYGNVYGPRQDPHGEAGVVAIFTGHMLNGRQCIIDGDGEQRKDYVFVGDVARANVLALTMGSGSVFNIGTGEGISVNQIFRTLHEATGNTVAPQHGAPRPGDVRNFWLDCSRAGRDLGWRPTTSFAEGIAVTVDAYRAVQR